MMHDWKRKRIICASNQLFLKTERIASDLKLIAPRQKRGLSGDNVAFSNQRGVLSEYRKIKNVFRLNRQNGVMSADFKVVHQSDINRK